jgi:hypothetical protein
VWQPRTSRPLTAEDAREITANLVGFFRLLAEWDRRDKEGQAATGPKAAPDQEGAVPEVLCNRDNGGQK